MKKIPLLIFGIILAGLLIFGYIWFYVPFSDEGSKIGQLNDFRHKGYIFKTYEGRLIQTGIKTAQLGGIQSNTFEFSVENDKVAEQLKAIKDQQIIRVHYKEYYATLPWRGHSKYVVDSIEISDAPSFLTPSIIE